MHAINLTPVLLRWPTPVSDLPFRERGASRAIANKAATAEFSSLAGLSQRHPRAEVAHSTEVVLVCFTEACYDRSIKVYRFLANDGAP